MSLDHDGAVATEPSQSVSLAAVGFGLALAALPVFLVGGLAVQIRAELGFSETQLGAAVTGAFLLGAVAGPFGGRLADRLGPRTAVLIGAALSAASLAGIALTATDWPTLAAFLSLTGISFAFMDPGLAIVITQVVPARRHGLAFGIKEASIPVATLAAGLAVPAIALTLGWRWAFLLGAVPLLGLLILLPRLRLPPRREARPATVAVPVPNRKAVVIVAVAAAFGSTASSGVGVFLTESAVAMGLAPGSAGYLLAAGSVAGIIARIVTGIRADRFGRPQLGVIAAMMGSGAAAMALGAIGTGPLLVIGTLGAFAGGWGWTGLLFLSLVRSSPEAPGAVAGIGLTGLAIGNAVGPLAFGATAQALSFGAAWAGAATMAGAAALLMKTVQPAFDRAREA